MRFRVTNIKPGYCEIWANERDGYRYKKLAVVKFDESRDDRRWHWSAKENEPPFYMPSLTHAFLLRRDCIADCIRTALIRQMERAIEQQPKESEFWNSPRRDALSDIWHSGYFSWDEKEEWQEKSMTFEEDA